jgi:hypothetical protein
MTTTPLGPQDLRARAVRHLKKKRDLQGHVLVYVLVNASLVLIWAITSPGGFFWPVFIMAFWGVGLIMNAWDVYRVDDFQEAEVEREMRHLAGRS